MTSTSISEREYNQLAVNIGTAVNSFEAPVKAKHIRAAIDGTFLSNGVHAFWAISLRQPLQDNRITAWKFCHVFHEIIREGNPLVVQQSMLHQSMITEMGELWGKLNDGFGVCIKFYTKLLVAKLSFHNRNPRIPGNLILQHAEFDKIAGNDINVYFQLAAEMFDYLEGIVALQVASEKTCKSLSKFSMFQF